MLRRFTSSRIFHSRDIWQLILVLALYPAVGWTQTKSIAANGVAVVENFNGLASTGTTSSLLPNGVLFNETGTSSNVNSTYTVGTGTSSVADTYSFGSTAGATDRALGSIASATLVSTIVVAYTNNTGQPINQLTISYTGEQYRLGTVNRADRLDFQYSTNSTNAVDGTYIDVDQLDFPAPIATGSVGALDGNLAANRTLKAYTITGLTLVNGATIRIRFIDFVASGNDDGLAIDDLSVTSAVTPPISDTTPPIFTAAFPAIGSITTTSFSIASSLNEAGTAYYVVLPDGAAAPNAAQVKNAQNAASAPVESSLSGSIPAAANTTQTSQVVGLTAATAYDVYVVAEDVVPNLQAIPVKLDVLTATPAPAPEINVQQAGADLLAGATYSGFATTAVGTSDAKTFTIQNLGTQNLTLSGVPPVVVSGVGSSQFVVRTQPGTSITGPTGTSDFVVAFTPTTVGTKTARLTISSNDADESTYTINLTATAVSVPTVTTTTVTAVGTTTAVTGGNVLATGDVSISARGVVYSTSARPRLGVTGVIDEPATNSPSTGSYSSNLGGLMPGTTYYVAAYAINRIGTSYGADQVFTTVAAPVIPPLLGYDFAAGDTPSTQDTNVTGTAFSRVGVSANSATNRFNSSGWPTAASPNPAAYIQFTFAPNPGYQASLTSLTFLDQSSGSGPAQYEVRSSLDNYATALASGTTGGTKTITLTGYNGLTSGVTFRFYAFASASGAGTYSVDDVNLFGTLSVATTPVLTATVPALTFSTPVGTTATAQTYTLNGSLLIPNSSVTIAAPASFEVSTLSATTGFATQQQVNTTATGTLIQQVWVRFIAGPTLGTTPSASVVNDASGIIATVEVTGTTTPAPGLVRWDGGGDGTSFGDALNWDTNRLPAANDDVVLDHSFVSAAYAVTLPAVASGTLNLGSLIINPNSGFPITTTLPATNTADDYLRFTNPTNALVLYGGATFINSSGSTGGGTIPVDIVAAGANFIIYNGGRYVHQTARSASALLDNLSAAAGTETGLFEFNSSSGSTTVSASGRTFGSLAFRATGTGAQSYVVSGGAALVVRGNLSTDANATLTVTLNASVNVGGNLINNGSFRFAPANPAIQQQLVFNGSTAQRISGTPFTELTLSGSSGISAAVDIVLNNATGLTLATAVRANGGLILTNGRLTTTSSSLLTVAGAVTSANGSFVNGPLAREVATTGAVMFPIGKDRAYRPLTLFISTAPAGITTYTAEQQEGAPADQILLSPVSQISRIRYYTLTANPIPAPTTFEGNIELSFGSDDGVTDPTISSFIIAKSNGSGWGSVGRSRNTATSIISTPFTSFSNFSLASTDPSANPLPVTLVSFAAQRSREGVQLRWATATEQNNAHFEVQRSVDGRTFGTVAIVAGQGQSNRSQQYTVLDQHPPAGPQYYRLRQVDVDGTATFSPVVLVAAQREVVLYPNPARTKLHLTAPVAATYQVRDARGNVVVEGSTSTGTVTLSVESLPAGLYQLRVASGSGYTTQKFVKVE